MDAHELMLRRSQDICVLALVNARFSILKKQKPTKLNLSIADGPRRPRRSKFEFSFVGNDRRPSRKPGTRRENRNALDSPDLSPFIPDDRDIYDFQFSLVGKIWDGRETEKSQTVWDFPDI